MGDYTTPAKTYENTPKNAKSNNLLKNKRFLNIKMSVIGGPVLYLACQGSDPPAVCYATGYETYVHQRFARQRQKKGADGWFSNCQPSAPFFCRSSLADYLSRSSPAELFLDSKLALAKAFVRLVENHRQISQIADLRRVPIAVCASWPKLFKEYLWRDRKKLPA